MKEGQSRILILDAFRGFAVVAMIVHHASYDLESFYGLHLPFFHGTFFKYLQLFFVLIFILTSGICTGFSRSCIKRGAILLGVAMALTFGTMIFAPDQVILFGILHFMGCSMIIYGLSKRALAKLPWKVGFFLFAALFAGFYAWWGSFGLQVQVPFLFPLGLTDPHFFSADYYPLIPWVLAYFAGTFLSKPILEKKFPAWFYRVRVPLFPLIGRYSLPIFVLHQPILVGIFFLLLGQPKL